MLCWSFLLQLDGFGLFDVGRWLWHLCVLEGDAGLCWMVLVIRFEMFSFYGYGFEMRSFRLGRMF